MKRIISLIATSAIVIPIVSTIACSPKKQEGWKQVYQPPKFNGTKNDKKLVTVVSDPENPRWQKAKKELETSGNEVFKSQMANIIKKANEQNSWLNTHKNDGDAFIIGATDDSLSNFINNTKKPVIAYDRLIKKVNSDNYNWYVTFDNSKVGFLQGATILGHLYGIENVEAKTEKEIIDWVKNNKLSKEKGIISVAGDPADNNAKLFFNGAKSLLEKAMDEDSNFKWYGSNEFDKNAQGNWDYSAGQTYMGTTIGQLNEDQKTRIAAVLSPNDGMANAAIVALTDKGLDPKKIWITGQDSNDQALNHLVDGQQDMTIFKPDAKAARLAVALAANLVDGDNTNDDKNGMTSFLKSAYPGIKFNIHFGSDSTYKSEVQGDNKPINTVLLTPDVIYKSNIGDFFQKTK